MKVTMPYEQFQEHVREIEAAESRTGDLTIAEGHYAGRRVQIGIYDHETGIAELHWI